MKNKIIFKNSKIRNLSYLMILLVVITLFGLKFIEFVNAYQQNENQANERQENNRNNFYLNLDIVNLNDQNLLFDINNVKSDLNKGNKTINISLSYNAQSNYDVDNDGIENLRGVIDFSVSNTFFNWGVDKNKLCTRWEVYSIDTNKATTICHGNDNCCRFINLAPSRTNWSEVMYLTFGMYGASENNIASAQVIYVDYNLSTEKPYAEIYYSKWSSLSAIFKDNIDLIKNISIEDALKNIEKIRSKNKQIKKIDLRDKDGNELKEENLDKNVSIVFDISKSANNIGFNALSSSSSDREIIISINNFNASNADWNKSDSISITTEKDELSNSLKEIGISPKVIVSISGVNDFLDNEGYYGFVQLSVTELFNSVIYCPDEKISSCRIAPKCLHEFKGTECYIKNDSILTIYVPHFSSIIVAFDNSSANLTINSPDNSSILQSGENVYLNFTTNETINANYSLDNQNIISLENGTSFNTLLNGTLAYGILTNGQHNLSIYVRDVLGNSAIVNYSFIINDTIAPNISINITNNSVFNGTSLSLPIKISSNEYSNIAYKMNNNNFSAVIDLGAGKLRTINLTITNGQNNLIINASDLHYNSIVSYLSFNFTLIRVPSCSDAVQNGDETGIDCGGSCFSCITFSVTTDKSSYNLTDNVFITVIARANSSVNVTVSKQNIVTYRHTFVPVFAGAPIAESRLISNTTNAGNYTINATMYYLNITENKNATFEMLAPSSNPISVTINPNATTINEGDTILFSSIISGNISTVSYKWDFQNDGVIDSTSTEPTYTYPSNGTYTVNLTVSDLKWNQTDIEIITVKKLYNLTIFVKDNATSNPIENAEVKFDDESANTTNDGKANYIKIAGRYSLIVKKPGYITFSNKTEINGNGVIEVNLLEEDNQAPIIAITAPEDKIVTSNNSITFRYKAIDESAITCKLYLSSNSSLWEIEGMDQNVVSGTESFFVLNDLKNGTYSWKIGCIDENGNSNFSEIYTFSIDTSLIDNTLSVDLNEQDKIAEDITSQIDVVMASIDSLNMEEKETAEAMQLKKKLEKAKVAIQRANRDLHSLKWRRLNATELEEETQKILERIENAKDTMPKKIEIIDKNEFVKYPNKEDISKALQVLINSTNLKFSKKEFNNLVQENYKLQSLLTVTTKAKIVDVEFISGDKKTITLIQKIVNSEKNLDNLIFYEVIPKDIAKNLSELELLFEYEIIDNDPVVKIDIQKVKDFSYYLNKRISIEDTEKIKSILLNKNLKSESKNLITGFASFDRISSAFTSSDLVKTADLRLIVEFIIIVVLLIIFGYYQFGSSGKFELMFDKESKEKLEEFSYLAEKIANYLNQNKYDEAKLLYKEINSIFKELPKNVRSRIYKKIIDIHARMDIVYMDKSLGEALILLSNNQKEKALHLYLTISDLYKNLPKEYKSQIHLKCIELHKRLNS